MSCPRWHIEIVDGSSCTGFVQPSVDGDMVIHIVGQPRNPDFRSAIRHELAHYYMYTMSYDPIKFITDVLCVADFKPVKDLTLAQVVAGSGVASELITFLAIRKFERDLTSDSSKSDLLKTIQAAHNTKLKLAGSATIKCHMPEYYVPLRFKGKVVFDVFTAVDVAKYIAVDELVAELAEEGLVSELHKFIYDLIKQYLQAKVRTIIEAPIK